MTHSRNYDRACNVAAIAAGIALALWMTTPLYAESPAPGADAAPPALTTATTEQAALTADAINGADLSTIPAEFLPEAAPVSAEAAPVQQPGGITVTVAPSPKRPDPAIIRLQVLLDRAGASPGVIDGFDGDNVRKAVLAFEIMQGLPADGALDPDMLARLESPDPVVGTYTITAEDAGKDITGPLPTDYAELARLEFLGYATMREKLAERFHMDEDLMAALNPGAAYAPGDTIIVTGYGPDRQGQVTRIEADKRLRQVRGYDAAGNLLVAYPATIGSPDNPSPSGTHTVEVVVRMPDYTYNPKNFVQGNNTEVLKLPPGPNGPVGSVWIDLSEPTYGIHGTPVPDLIDKTGSHGCVRLTNWDAAELAGMVDKGVPVEFVE